MFTVLWDNDGVLVDTEGLYFRATKIVLAKVDVLLTAQQFKQISLRDGMSTFKLAEERGIGGDEVARLRRERDRVFSDFLRAECPVIPGAKEALRALHGKVRMGVVTSSSREHFEIAHARSGLTEYMDFILTREDYEQTKPHPEPYLTAIRRHGLDRSKCIVVEDSERGLAAATAAGLNCLVVLSELTADGEFRTARKVLTDISAVPGEVLGMADPQSTLRDGRQRHSGQTNDIPAKR
jgi:HAD superfamily hydrolase (TIGR01509 family)